MPTNLVIIEILLFTYLFTNFGSKTVLQYSINNMNNDSHSTNDFIEKVDLDLDYNIKLSLSSALFDSTHHRIRYGSPALPFDKWKGIVLIDGKPVFGTDWELPKSILLEAKTVVNGKTITLDVSCMYNPWMGKPDKKDFSVNKTEGGFLITGKFSDGAGRYKAQWLIVEDVSVRTMLVKEEC